ncbi:hypothetical protein [Terasakiella pusilla]|uniref:hypothetical protein n=1 Tax=Terasakiella pusilla TaxID=64973 RepID=UPI003AA7F88A
MEDKLTDFPIVFLDVEAAGFDSYPIEVGWAKIIKQNVISKSSFLIYHRNWIESKTWDPKAELVHGITQGDLKVRGQSLEKSACQLNNELPKIVYSDAEDYEQYWVGQIFQETRINQEFKIKSEGHLFHDIDPMAYQVAESCISDIAPRKHRAIDDAYRLAVLYHLARWGEFDAKN